MTPAEKIPSLAASLWCQLKGTANSIKTPFKMAVSPKKLAMIL